MDTLTKISVIAGIVSTLIGSLGLLYKIIFGDKNLSELWKERRLRNASKPPETPKRTEITTRSTITRAGVFHAWPRAFWDIFKLLKARRLYKQAAVEPPPDFHRLLDIAGDQITATLVWTGGAGLITAIVLVIISLGWPMAHRPPSTPVPSTPTPAPTIYHILVIWPDARTETLNCGGDVRLTSDKEVLLKISPVPDGELRWASAVQGPLSSNSLARYTPKQFINNIDIISFYRNDAKQCWLLFMEAGIP